MTATRDNDRFFMRNAPGSSSLRAPVPARPDKTVALVEVQPHFLWNEAPR
jgi:hypothetical protein